MKCQVHKYRRFRRSRDDIANNKGLPIWRCINPGCKHYVNRNFVIGRPAECWRCGRTFTMSEKTLQLKPLCGCQAKKATIPNVEAVKDSIVADILDKVKA